MMHDTALIQHSKYQTESLWLNVLLHHDGSVMTLLEAMFDEEIIAECLGQGINKTQLKDWVELNFEEDVLVRAVFLTGIQTQKRYVYATSMIRMDYLSEEVRRILLEGEIGIGKIIKQFKIETYRELISCKLVYNRLIHSVFPDERLITERQYKIYMEDVPVMLIKEYYPHSLYSLGIQ